MTNNIKLNESAKNRWPNLSELVFADAEKQQHENIYYIHNGYFEHWAPEHRTDPDRGIKAYSTELKWKQYQNGKISREKAIAGFQWSKALPYGSGYAVLPYFEGGVGSSCHWEIFKQAGYITRCTGSGKMFDCWEVRKEAE